MASEYIQVNTNLAIEDVSNLDRMMVEDGFDNRSAFLRKLIRQEDARRKSIIASLAIESIEEDVERRR